MEVLVSNVKISCKVHLINSNEISFNTDNTIKRYNNFVVIRKKYSFIIFTKTKQNRHFHVNITKIPSTEHIAKALDELKLIINSEFVVKIFKVENMTCLYQSKEEIKLLRFYNHLKLNEDFEIIHKRYDPEKFPGVFLKIKKCSALIFSSEKIVIIGASSEEDAKQGIKIIIKLLKKYKIE